MNLPLPASMPWRARADIMVRRGEAKSFSDACRLMAARRKTKPAAKLEPVKLRLPYTDN